MIFHSKNGLFFKRDDDGAVTIIKTSGLYPAEDGSNIEFSQTLGEGIWASIISSMSAGNEHDMRWHAALEFHKSYGRIRILPVMELPQ